jgi:hypothetical protein
MINNPIYKPFIIRVFFSFTPLILVMFFLVIFLGLFYGKDGIIETLIIGIGLLLYSFITFLIRNVDFLKSITINEEEKRIELEIYRFNHSQKKVEYNIRDVNIEIQEVYSIYKLYYLRIVEKKNNKQIFRQPCTGGWDTKKFVAIVKVIDKINGTTTDFSCIGGAYKYDNDF